MRTLIVLPEGVTGTKRGARAATARMSASISCWSSGDSQGCQKSTPRRQSVDATLCPDSPKLLIALPFPGLQAPLHLPIYAVIRIGDGPDLPESMRPGCHNGPSRSNRLKEGICKMAKVIGIDLGTTNS